MERRQFFTVLATAGAGILAGCTSGDDTDSDTGDKNGTGKGDDDGTPSSSSLGDPTEPLEEFITAAREADVESAIATFHPAHPFHPDDLDNESGGEFNLSMEGLTIESVETRVVTEPATLENIRDRITGAKLLGEANRASSVIENQPTALVGATLTTSQNNETELLGVTAAYEGEWLLLWQGGPLESEEIEFEARVVDEVTFDTEENRARVQLVDNPVADSVIVESANTDAYTESDTVETVDYLTVGLDSAGDELLVRATIDGESRVVHREQYPPNERIVDDIVYKTDVDEDDPFGARARIELNDVAVDGELTAESTKADWEITMDSIATTEFVTIGFDADGDEIVIHATVDGQSAEIHRERYRP